MVYVRATRLQPEHKCHCMPPVLSQGLWLSAPAPAEAVPHFLRYEADDVREAITATSKLRPDQVRRLLRDQRSAEPSHMIGVNPGATSSSACSSCAKWSRMPACAHTPSVRHSSAAPVQLLLPGCHHASQPGHCHAPAPC